MKIKQLVLSVSFLVLVSCGDKADNSPATVNESVIPEATYDLRIKGDINKAKDSVDNVRYLGEIENLGTGVASRVSVKITSYDVTNTVLGTGLANIYGEQYFGLNGNSFPNALGEGEFGSFEMVTDISFISVARYETEIIYNTIEMTKPDISLSVVGSITPKVVAYDEILYSGEITNDGVGVAEFVKINFTMKNSSGLVIDTNENSIVGSDCSPTTGVKIKTCLAPGEIGTFETRHGPVASEVDSYYYRIYFSSFSPEVSDATTP